MGGEENKDEVVEELGMEEFGDKIDDDDDMILLPASMTRCQRATSSLVTAERSYWTEIDIRRVELPAFPSSIAAGITCLAVSPCGRFVAAGTLKGSLAVVSLGHKSVKPFLVSFLPIPEKAKRLPIIEIKWNARCDSVVILDVLSTARVISLVNGLAGGGDSGGGGGGGKRGHGKSIMVAASKWRPTPAEVTATVTLGNCRRPEDGLVEVR